MLDVEQIVNTLVIFPCDRCHDATLAHCGVIATGLSQLHIDGRRVTRQVGRREQGGVVEQIAGVATS